MHEGIYEILVRRARRKRLITYTDLAAVAALDMADDGDRLALGRYLDEISDFELVNGRPLLAAIIVSKETNRPGAGFFVYARSRARQGDKGDDAYWSEEVAAVHDYWSAGR